MAYLENEQPYPDFEENNGLPDETGERPEEEQGEGKRRSLLEKALDFLGFVKNGEGGIVVDPNAAVDNRRDRKGKRVEPEPEPAPPINEAPEDEYDYEDDGGFFGSLKSEEEKKTQPVTPYKPPIDVWSGDEQKTRTEGKPKEVYTTNVHLVMRKLTKNIRNYAAALEEIVAKLRAGNVVFLNLEECGSEEDEERIIMFLRGASCYQKGGFVDGGKHVYIITPPNVEIDSDQSLPNDNFLPEAY
jgi:FtsZ-interacting cell division protein YlmF